MSVAFFSSRFAQMEDHSWSESWIRFTRPSSSRYYAHGGQLAVVCVGGEAGWAYLVEGADRRKEDDGRGWTRMVLLVGGK